MQRIAKAAVLVLMVLALTAPAWASAESEIKAATSQKKVVFLVVTQVGARGTERAVEIARQAQGLVPASTVVVLDRGAAENQTMVQRMRVSGAPVPLILVLAPNGIVSGGAFLKDATPQVLVGLIPTPKKAEMLLMLSQQKTAFVVVSRKTMAEGRGVVFEACTQAMQLLERKAATIVVDVDDKAEQAWLKELNITGRETAPVTIVFNPKGQKTQVFRTVMTAQQLVDAARKKVECCPDGSC